MTGNTKKVAEAIAEAVGCKAENVAECRLDEPVDLLFLGGAIYATYKHDYAPPLRQFIKSLKPGQVKKVALFVTYTFSSSMEILKKHVQGAGIALSEGSFECRGRFLVFNLRHPNKIDLDGAKDFARGVS